MPQTLIAASNSGTLPSAFTGFTWLNGRMSVSGAEADRQSRIGVAVTLRNLLIRITANTINGTTTLKSRKNAADGTLLISVSASTTGTFEDVIDGDAVAAADDVDYAFTTLGSSGSISVVLLSVTVDHPTLAVVPLCLMGSTSTFLANITVNAPSTGEDNAVAASTESDMQWTARMTLTQKRLGIRLNTNTSTGATTYNARKNTANGALTISVAAGLTGLFEDTVNSNSLVSGDITDNQIVGAGTAAQNLARTTQYSHFENSDVVWKFPLLCAGFGKAAQAASSTNYLAGQGASTTASGNEADQALKVRGDLFPWTAKNAYVKVTQNSTSGDSTYTFRKNTADTAITILLVLGTTGIFEDTTHTASIIAGDLICHKIVSGLGGTITTPVLAVEMDVMDLSQLMAAVRSKARVFPPISRRARPFSLLRPLGQLFTQATAGTLSFVGSLVTVYGSVATWMAAIASKAKVFPPKVAYPRPSQLVRPLAQLYTQATAGVLSFAGVLVRQTRKPLAGVVSFGGTLLSDLRGAATWMAAIIPGIARGAGTADRAAFQLQRAVERWPRVHAVFQRLPYVLQALAGTLSFSGALARQTRKSLAGVLSFAGVLGTSLASIATFMAAIIPGIQRGARIALMAARLQEQRIQEWMVGRVRNARRLAVFNLFVQALAGTLSFTGIVTKRTGKRTAGSLSFSGVLVRRTKKALAGAVSFAGALSKRTAKKVAGILSFVGTMVGQIAGFTPTGNVIKKLLRGVGTFNVRRGKSRP